MSTQIFAEVGQSNDLMEKLSTRAKLKNDEIVLGRFGKADKFDDIRMVELSHYLDLFQDIGTL